MKTNERTSQLEKRLVRSGKLLPANQKPSRAIEPGEKPFHDPPPRLLCRFQTVGRDFLGRMLLESFPIPLMEVGIQAHMRLIASQIEVCIHRVVIIASIQTQILRMLNRRLRWLHDLAVQSGGKQLHVMTIGPIDDQSQRYSSTVTQDAPFGPLFAAVGGSGSDGGLGERGFDG